MKSSALCWLLVVLPFLFSDQRRVIINSVLNWCVFKQDQVITISNKFKLFFTLASPLFESLFPNETETFVIKSKPIGRRLREFVLLVYKQFYQNDLQKWLQYDNLKPINCKTREKLLPCCYFCFIKTNAEWLWFSCWQVVLFGDVLVISAQCIVVIR